MTRKKNNSETISLFSFQDIMASVIGMLFFVVILLSLSIVTEVVPASEEPTKEESGQLAELQQRTGELRQQKTDLEKRITSISKMRLQAASVRPQQTLTQLKQMRANLDAMYRTIEEEQKRLKSLVAQAESSKTTIHSKKKQLEIVQEQIQKAKGEVSRAKSKPRLTFIIDKRPDNLKPWLLEISKDSLRVGSQDGQGLVIDFEGKSHEERARLFLEWARNQNQKERYFVLLIKPSGIQHVAELRKNITELGFEIGTDLIPEKWRPF